MNEPHKRLVIASLTNHLTDGRIVRQIESLRDSHYLISAGTTVSNRVPQTLRLEPQSIEKDLPHRISSMALLLTRRFERHYWSRPWVLDAERRLGSLDFDAMLVNDLPLLPVALRVAGDRPVAFDAHEYYPRQREDERRFRILMRPYYEALCQRYLPRVETMFTVSPGLAEEYAAQFAVKPVIVRNAPQRHSLEPSPLQKPLRIIYHGVAQQRRSVELVIDVIRELEGKFELHLMIQSRQSRVQALQRRAEGCQYIHFHKPVANRDVVKTINQFDLGIAFFPPVTFNLKYCLPNKLFEYIQARLGIIVGPSPDMAAVVESAGCGVVTDSFDPQSLKHTLLSIRPEDVLAWKQNSAIAANQFCWEQESQAIMECCQRMLSKSNLSDLSVSSRV